MKAIRIHQFGPTEEALQLDEVPTPAPGPDELLIRVAAASLNRADLGLRSGSYRVAAEELPIIPGREFAGVVDRTGSQVNEFKAAQRVVAYTGKGGYAEYATAKASEVRPIPDGIDLATAAAVPTVFLTAWFALLEDAKLQPAEWLLVQAGSSGVGIAAIQIAKYLGAQVITTTSDDKKAKKLHHLGADVVINYTDDDFVFGVRRASAKKSVDVVLEMIGGEVYTKSLQVLAPGGRLISLGGAFGPIPETPPQLSEGRKASRFSITNYLKAHPEGFREVDTFLRMIKGNTFHVVIDKAFPLAEARAAQHYLQSRDHFGKIVLTMV
ncbi:MAG: quinone oxidoreductase family protein [Alphaproteobacteria bacterium]